VERRRLARTQGADLGFDLACCRASATSQEIELGFAIVRASRITYVGELGWELDIPTEFMTGVYDENIAAGAAFGLKHCGYHALNALRMEKAYRHWGHDITD
jgi:glycine cleavage system aminomethyltransferase T